jgi:pyruvate/2-oxoglutarate dehydrogenase complex dihydrolipoamide acyltransferase (E2) component
MLAVMPTSDEPTAALPPDESIGAQDEATTAGTADVAVVLEESAVIAEAGDNLSPAVRRLVRQYDLDITGIHGTGPDGRIRVGDVIGMLGPRAEQAVRGVTTPRPAPAESADGPADDNTEESPADDAALAPAPAPAPTAASTAPITTVFECDLARVLAHRKRLREENVELLLTGYFLAAYLEALGAVPEVAIAAAPRIGVELTTADGDTRTLTLDASGVAAEPLAQRARTIDAALRRSVGAALSDTHLLVHHYGASGSLIATPTPLGAGHVASLGIGRVRREIVLRNVDGDETPRATTRCHLSLSFLPERVTLARANQFLAHAVRQLEQWPE